ncbi:hypothetical protein DFQ27_004558 [Actinomortierella ambigua]|uniref:HECT-type E3 ubiquitin transferase n=1 Tax=Actinomortierella ambigua TaxID=1343610 RepID=A0A9P6QHP4_9FUNG|nr:hypothetical protein DFQ27_004558 [Actinomortierella ambigua]
MKIKKTPVKKLVVPPPAIRNLIKTLKECPEAEIPTHIEATPEWIWPRGDLFHWTGVLNRFDDILDHICKAHDLKKPQSKEFSPETKRMTLSILNFSRLLLESCTNRNLYSSNEQLNDLLFTRDLDILESCLRLMLRPAQRHSAQRATKSFFNISQDRFLALAHSWGNKEVDLDLTQLVQADTDIPDRLTGLNFQFFRTVTSMTNNSPSAPSSQPQPSSSGSSNLQSSSSTSAVQPPSIIPSKHRRSSASNVSATAGVSSSTAATPSSNNALSEGMVVIQATDLDQFGKTDYDVLSYFVKQYHVPEEHHFQLLCRIRVARGVKNVALRRQLLTIRILAIAVMSHVLTESTLADKFFMYEPDIIQSLVDLVHPDHNVPFPLQTVALLALDGLAHLRNKQADVLTSMNASASHGVLLYILRKTVAGLDAENPVYPQEFVDTVCAFITFVISSQSGGSMVISAGIIPVLLQLLSNKHASQLKNVTKTISIQDSLIYGFATAFTSFISSGGLNLVVQRIKDEVEFILALVQDTEANQMTGVTTASSTDLTKEESSPVPFERTALLKAMFKFLHHMMQSPGTQEGLRNLIETSLPATLKKIMEHPQALGNAVYAYAINTMTSFIHNEPTSLAIMQEAKIPQTFLASLTNEIPASADVATCIPGAFGALCLNSTGLEMFKKEFHLRKFFDVFTSVPHARAFQDNDSVTNMGLAVDELVRHQPTLKPAVNKEIMGMMKRVLTMLEGFKDNEEEMSFCSLRKSRATTAPPLGMPEDEASKDEKKESAVAQVIEASARFCESYFQNLQCANDFVKAGGIPLLMNFFTLPTLPYDFANSPAYYTLCSLLKLLSESNPSGAVTVVMQHIEKTLDAAKPLFASTSPISDVEKYLDASDLSAEETERGNKLLATLIGLDSLTGLMSEMHAAAAMSHGRHAAGVLNAFVGAKGESIVAALGELHRACLWECVVLRRKAIKLWNEPSTKSRRHATVQPAPGTVEDYVEEPTSAPTDSASTEVQDAHDPKVINTKYFKFVLTQLTHFISRLYHGIAKMLFARRDFEKVQRSQAFKVADSLAKVLQANVTWTRATSADQMYKYPYLTTMLRLIPHLFLDERSNTTLQTIIVVSFVRTGGAETIFEIMDSLWKEMKTLQAEGKDAKDETLGAVYTAIEFVLGIYQSLTSAKLMLDSSHTPALVSKDGSKSTDYFEPYDFIIRARKAVLPKARNIWMDPALSKCPPSVVRNVIQIVINILKANGESKPEVPARTRPPVVIESTNIFGSRPPALVADANAVAMLLDMGFPRAAAESALIRCNNNLESATEYLLTHQEVVATALYDQQRQEAAARAAAQASTQPNTGDSATTEASAEGSGEGSSSNSNNALESTAGASSTSAAESAAAPTANADEDEEMDDEEALRRAMELSVSKEEDASEPKENVEEASASGPSKTEEEIAEELAQATKDAKEELNKAREDFHVLLVPRSLEIISAVKDSVFSIKNLLLLTCKEKSKPVLDIIVEDIAKFKTVHESTDESVSQDFGVRLRLMALLFGEASLQPKLENYKSDLLPQLTSIFAQETNAPTAFSSSTWLSPLMLMIESFVSLNDEPRVAVDEASADSKAPAAQQDKEMKEAIFSDAELEKMLVNCMDLLKRPGLTKEVVLSVFRLLVRLTRHHALAKAFLQADGLQLSFNTLTAEGLGVRGQQSLIVMILRHIVEDSNVLQATMEREISRWFNQPSRPRSCDIQLYLRHNNYLGLRDLDAFIAGTLKLCKVSKYDSSYRAVQLTLNKPASPTEGGQSEEKPTEGDETTASKDTDKEKEKEKEATEKDPGVGSSTSAPVLSAATLTDASRKYASEFSETIINFLVSELLGTRSTPTSSVAETPVAASSSVQSHATSESSSAAAGATATLKKEGAASSEASTSKTAEPAPYDTVFVYRCFLLQCLNELLQAYPSCKMDLMNYSRRKSGKENSTHKVKGNWLNYLINDLMPYRGAASQKSELELRKHGVESAYSASLLVALCSSNDEEDDKAPVSEAVLARRFIVDGLIRAFKDAVASTEPIETKYGRFLSLSDLCNRLLVGTPASGPNARTSEDASMSVVKVMLEKNVISTLTNVLADIDLSYPHARILVNALLKPLEHLTKLSLRMSRVAETRTKYRRRSTPLSAAGSGTGSGDDAPDLYRNSALGILDGAAIESEEDDEDDISNEEDDIFEGDEFDEETASDASDLSDDSLSGDEEERAADDGGDPMEMVLRGPFPHHEISDDEEHDDDDDGDDGDDDDEDDDMELQEALEREEAEGDDVESLMEWDQGGNHPIMLGEDEIDEVIEDDDEQDLNDTDDFYRNTDPRQHLHQHHHNSASDGEEGDEDEDAGSDDDDHDGDEDDDIDDTADTEDEDEEVIEFNNLADADAMGDPWTMSSFVIDDDEALRGDPLMDPRHRRGPRGARRPDDHLRLLFGDGDHGRFSYLEDDGFQMQAGAGRGAHGQGADNVITHPLLAQPTTQPPAGISEAHRLRPGRGLPDWNSFEELLSGNANQVLSQLLSGEAVRAGNGAFRVELNHGHAGTVFPVNGDGITLNLTHEPAHGHGHGHSHAHGGAGAGGADHATPHRSEMFALVNEFVPFSTAQRWSQECRMMYGATAQEKAGRLVNHVVNALIPSAKEEHQLKQARDAKELEQRRKEEAERARLQEERRKAEEEERKKAEEAEQARKAEEEAARLQAEAAAAAAATATGQPADEGSTSMEVEGDVSSSAEGGAGEESSTAAEPSEPAAPARVTVMIDGEEIDITDSGMDPEFLNALPEDMRREVVDQHLQEGRRAVAPAPAATTASNINLDFMDALTQEARDGLNEILLEQQQHRTARGHGAGGAGLDVAGFVGGRGQGLAGALPVLQRLPQLRQVLQTGPPMGLPIRHLDEMLFPRSLSASRGGSLGSVNVAGGSGSAAKKPLAPRGSLQLVDKSSLATLVRLMFLPQPLTKNILNKLLVNLCENSKTRADLLSLLLSILQDGGADLAAVDKSFAQMSLRPKVLARSGSKGKGAGASATAAAPPPASGNNVPNLVAQRCFDTLYYIVNFNEQATLYFLQEQEQVIIKRPSKKGKGKDKAVQSKYPIVFLLDLLEQPIFLQNVSLMEQLMTLIAIICRPLTVFNAKLQKEKEKEKGKEKGKEKADETAQQPTDEATTAASAPTADAAGDAGSQEAATATTAAAAAAATTTTTTTTAVEGDNGSEDVTMTDAKAQEATKATTEPAEPPFKPPVIPDHCLKLIVRVLTAGECSSRTFQYTLSVIQNLSILEGARDLISSELVTVARELGAGILEDLGSLCQTLENAMTGVEVQGVALEKFSPSSSKQAKLLRVLKTIDYMYSRKQTPWAPPSTRVNVELAPTVDPEEADAIMPRIPRDVNSETLNLNEDEEKATKIYDSLGFYTLWTKVGAALEQVQTRSDMTHVATVLLPLIESFMVVCKYVGLRPSTLEMDEATCRATSTATEELFLEFTDKHRKILNVMVRNNPSLMSGSFSLLVHNPKMLDFDNKRNYFTQQLHKRTVNRHYDTLQLNVRRAQVFEDSYAHLQGRDGDEIKYSKLNVRFYEEEGVDGGGLTREWFQVLARQMFNPDYALFKTSAADKLTYQPNRASWVNPDHLSFFKFVGRVIGKAIYDGRLLDAYFTRSFYKHILGRPVDYRDVEAIDPEYYKSLVWMLENDITDIVEETFSVETDDFGNTKVVDLKPNGRNIPVTEENKHEYVKLITEQKLTLAIKDQIHSFLQGFHEIIPASLISIFNEQELELLISGLPDIDIDEWKNNTEYHNYSSSSPAIQWFWRAVRSFDQTERAKLLQFVTGTSKVPLGGFSQLQGISGIQRFQIHKDFASSKRLPSAHTCFNQLDLPEYDTYEDLRTQLLTAISECATGFAFA